MDGHDDEMKDNMPSPTNSQKTVSDDEEIDYSVKPEFYDSDLDVKDESWVQKKRKGRASDAVLSCPACFTTLCLECQRHEKYVTQYRAVFVVNCKIGSDQVIHQKGTKPRKGKSGRQSSEIETVPAGNQTFKHVSCLVCSTEVGVIDEDEVYHFFNVLPSES
ncbi:putative E2F-associated phosphoprotein [Rosa chinensis]|uniref:Putative E2F-associated phosphoprotein n=1 Tax=Rosa chinensis TaxID=74649 RepID=A0A2P6QSC8_ROSCH|nr:E2F-associated phosphoprotein [Rosa chinensis]PRQ37084.1 putative E2F-associated phosphoprotein [Rosa chinensis]